MSEKRDMTDDWMNPHMNMCWEPLKPDNKMVYTIQRARRITTFGTPGFIIEWKEWASFDSKVERDKELKKLMKKHPTWRLKARDYNPYLASIGYAT